MYDDKLKKNLSVSIVYNYIICKYKIYQRFNPLSPHDALKHHFTSLKTDLFSYNQGF